LRRAPVAACGAALVVGLSGLAAAQPSAQPQEEAVRFQFRAPEACPDAASFTARVRSRTQRGREAAAEELARTFSIEVAQQPSGFVGTIAFLDDGGAPVSRRVGGEQCESVVDSLALITALALDATLREPEPPSTDDRPAPLPPVAVPPVTTAAQPTPPTSPPAPTRRAEPWLRSARVGVLGGYDSTIDGLPFGLLGQLDGRGGWSLRFAAHLAIKDRTVDAGRTAELRVLGLETSGCYALRLDELVVSPCAWLDLGTLRAEGRKSAELTTASADTILWASVGPELRVAWEPAAPFWVELRGSLGFPLVRHRFEFHVPDATVFEVPEQTAAAGLATGVRFW
jgi:hypothetical protein